MNKSLLFDPQVKLFYTGDENIHTLNFERSVPSQSYEELTNISTFQDESNLVNLKYNLVIIKFWVPYDDKYSYEFRSFILKEDLKGKKGRVRWQSISKDDCKDKLNRYFKLYEQWDEKIKKFFEDYRDFQYK